MSEAQVRVPLITFSSLADGSTRKESSNRPRVTDIGIRDNTNFFLLSIQNYEGK
jgi:hypothetical protein